MFDNQKDIFWMNQKGSPFVLIILAGFIILAAIPPILMIMFPAVDIIMRIVLIFMIFTTVRGFLGPGTPSLIVSAVLIYLLVIRHPYFSTSIYIMFYVLLAFQFMSVVIWSIGTALRPKQ